MKLKLLPVALFVALAATGCTAETPDSAYLSTLRESEPALVDVPDDDLIAVGQGACDLFDEQGFDAGMDQFVAQSAGAGISSSGAGQIAGAATGAYCPEYASDFE
jgi:hypothetical protein